MFVVFTKVCFFLLTVQLNLNVFQGNQQKRILNFLRTFLAEKLASSYAIDMSLASFFPDPRNVNCLIMIFFVLFWIYAFDP